MAKSKLSEYERKRDFGKTAGTPTPFLENDLVLGDLAAHVAGGNFLNEESLLALARRHGFNTAAIELILPTYGESLGLKGRICRHWTLNPHPTLIPASRQTNS